MLFVKRDIPPEQGLADVCLSEDRCKAQVSIVVCRHGDAKYWAAVRRYDSENQTLAYADVPGLTHVGLYVEKPTWLLGEAVQLSYANPHAFGLLRW